jgi:hypothetical protein
MADMNHPQSLIFCILLIKLFRRVPQLAHLSNASYTRTTASKEPLQALTCRQKQQLLSPSNQIQATQCSTRESRQMHSRAWKWSKSPSATRLQNNELSLLALPTMARNRRSLSRETPVCTGHAPAAACSSRKSMWGAGKLWARERAVNMHSFTPAC